MANQLECKLFLITHGTTWYWVLFLYCYDLYVFRYHHTGPVSGFFALRESLAILAEKVTVRATERYSLSFVWSVNLFFKWRFGNCLLNLDVSRNVIFLPPNDLSTESSMPPLIFFLLVGPRGIMEEAQRGCILFVQRPGGLGPQAFYPWSGEKDKTKWFM